MKLLWFYSRIDCKDNLCRPLENSKQQNAACLLGRSRQASLGLLGVVLPREQAAAVLACKLATLPRTGRSFTASPWLSSFSAASAQAWHPLMCGTGRAGRMLVARHSCNIRTDTLRLNPGFGLFVDNSHVCGSIRKFFACKILEGPQPETGNHHDEAQLAPCGLTRRN